MSQIKFKTNIKCGGCIETITPHLDGIESIQEWSVDLENPDRILTVKGDSLHAALIIGSLEKAGYIATPTGETT